MTEKSIKQITDQITKTLLKKNADYGGASFDLGMGGNFVHIYDKVKRLQSLVWEGKEPNFESVEDTLYDLMGYSIIGLHILNNEKEKNEKENT